MPWYVICLLIPAVSYIGGFLGEADCHGSPLRQNIRQSVPTLVPPVYDNSFSFSSFIVCLGDNHRKPCDSL